MRKELLSELFNEALLWLVNDRDEDASEDPAVEILDFEEEERYGGYCETCHYEYTVVTIKYRSESGDVRRFDHGEDFADLIRTLTTN